MFPATAKVPRRSQRHWIAIPVRIQLGALHVDGMTINVSEHGMFLFAAINLSTGTEIELAYCPPWENSTVHARAIVQRKAVYLYGLEFLDC